MKKPILSVKNLDSILRISGKQNGMNTLPKCLWPISNEGYSKLTELFLRKRHVDHYLGVCGGGTQNLRLLELIGENSVITDIVLSDIKLGQLLNFVDLSRIYNTTAKGMAYRDKIIAHGRNVSYCDAERRYSRDSKCECDWCRTNTVRPVFSSNLQITLYNQDVNKLILEAEPGVYLIYLSNIHHHMSQSRYSTVLKNVLRNPNILSGSLIFQTAFGIGCTLYGVSEGGNESVLIKSQDSLSKALGPISKVSKHL